MRDNDLDVLAVGETWLTADVPSSYIAVVGYEVVRGDTNSRVRKHGVCMYVRHGVRFEEQTVSIPNVVAVHLLDFDLWILAVYRPPSYSSEENSQVIDMVLEFCEGREAVVLGDFNLPTLRWCCGGIVQPGYVNPNDAAFWSVFQWPV